MGMISDCVMRSCLGAARGHRFGQSFRSRWVGGGWGEERLEYLTTTALTRRDGTKRCEIKRTTTTCASVEGVGGWVRGSS